MEKVINDLPNNQGHIRCLMSVPANLEALIKELSEV
jgi:hypothetical protein